ncbi:MAG TPA: acetyl-CoA carboxylase biotin carboxyl carrier protein subunit [Methylomirabilota bacterium]|jgi:acetyl/propionyl-CoA carboxylase alpha subunit|nr:acetyl-CoA carboxylase biotin carboxyl carrier protein subunit [Methylomirabilota bacterium]
MTDYEVTIDGTQVEPEAGWTLAWLDAEVGLARLSNGSRTELCLVEGSGTDWVVTLRGRRIPVLVRSWRERVLADAESSARGHDGPVEVRATLPGLVVAISVAEGDEVAAGATLLTIEAMKMQNEVRAPRSGRVTGLAVAPGQAVAAGTPLLRLE